MAKYAPEMILCVYSRYAARDDGYNKRAGGREREKAQRVVVAEKLLLFSGTPTGVENRPRENKLRVHECHVLGQRRQFLFCTHPPTPPQLSVVEHPRGFPSVCRFAKLSARILYEMFRTKCRSPLYYFACLGVLSCDHRYVCIHIFIHNTYIYIYISLCHFAWSRQNNKPPKQLKLRV